jgi:hypothetical protein
MKLLATAALCITTTLCHAESALINFAGQAPHIPVTSSIELPADYAVIPVNFYSRDDDPIKNLDNLHKITDAITEAAKQAHIKTHAGTTTLPGSLQTAKSFGSSISSPASGTSLQLLIPIQGRDINQAGREALAFLKGIPKIDQTQLMISTPTLAIDNPERYRERLLGQIHTSLQQTLAQFGNPKSFQIAGLESPVAVFQTDDSHVAVYIPYRLQIGQ